VIESASSNITLETTLNSSIITCTSFLWIWNYSQQWTRSPTSVAIKGPGYLQELIWWNKPLHCAQQFDICRNHDHTIIQSKQNIQKNRSKTKVTSSQDGWL